METCPRCEGIGKVRTQLDDIADIFTAGDKAFYKNVHVIKHPYDAILIEFGEHTTISGGENGDLFLNTHLEELKKLGYQFKSVGKTYLYLNRIKKNV